MWRSRSNRGESIRAVNQPLYSLSDSMLVKDFGDNYVYPTVFYSDIKNLVSRVNTIYHDTCLKRIYANVGSGKSIVPGSGIELNPTSWWKVFAGQPLKIQHQWCIEQSCD
ncbi:TonB-dependent receptor [Echinicola rosea]|nr:TonB-dependent receptor [Echinicola rosea]